MIEKEGLMTPDRGTDIDAADSSALFKRHMRTLYLDPDDLIQSRNWIAGMETGQCARCEARGKCIHDLDLELSDFRRGDWRDYCPGAPALSILKMLREWRGLRERL